MRRKLNIILLTGIILLFASCSEEILDKQPPGSASGDVITSQRGIEALLIGAYNALYGTDIFGGSLSDWEWGEISSDNAYFGAAASFNVIDSYNMLPTNSYPLHLWRSGYDGVARANDVLTFLQNAGEDLSESRAREIEAEAKFLRAWHHFRLQRVFWQVPYIKTVQELGGVDPVTIPNDRLIWDDIKEDLQYCIDNLPEGHPRGEPGRPHKYAAMAVKARVHLFAQEFSQAKVLLDNIINSGRFQLVDNYYDNFRETTENNQESIFEVQCNISDATANNTMRVMGMSFHQRGPASRGWGAYQPSQNLFEAFQVDNDGLPILDVEDRVALSNDMGIFSDQEFVPTDHLLDPRVDWTIARRGIPFLDWGIHEGHNWIRSQNDGGPYMTVKFHHYSANESTVAAQGGFKNSRNFRAYRYAHVLLWRAEVAVEEDDFETARTLVNMVRERAGNEVVMGRSNTYIFDNRPIEVDEDQPAANYSVGLYPEGAIAFSTKEEARKAVRHEIRVEFATEGHRFFDLRRWGIDGEVLNKYIAHDSEFRYFMRGITYDPEVHDYWPIPQGQIDLQTGVIMQDPNH
ncbi:MAG: RagB/SusD family nutrient uptake outer membrane protein [Bacteroidales bacterium]